MDVRRRGQVGRSDPADHQKREAGRHKSRTQGRGPKKTTHAVAATLAGALLIYVIARWWREPSVLDPFPAPQLASLPQFQGSHADRLLWGTYRPGLYFGMRMRRPRSPLLGLMWLDPRRESPLDSIRHEAQQGDGLQKYGWVQHDGESFGVQQLRDGQYNITTSWAKRWCSECDAAGDLGISISVERWAPRKRAQQAQQGGSSTGDEGGDGTDGDEEQQQEQQQRAASRKPISLLFYLANEDLSPLDFNPQALAAALAAGSQPQRVAGGAAEPLGDWSLYLSASSGEGQGSGSSSSSSGSGGESTTKGKANKLQASANFLAVSTPHFHNLTELAREGLYHGMVLQHRAGEARLRPALPNKAQPGANLVLLQVTAKLPIRLDLVLVASRAGSGANRGGKASSSGSGRAGAAAGAGAEGESARVAAVTGRQLDALLAQRGAEFGARFEETFGRVAAKQLPSGTAAVARAALSNMLGGLGYWYGHSLVRVPGKPTAEGEQKTETKPLWDAPLFSAVPSRSFFPRGFLWDEGFHQLLIREWSPAISREVLAHWLDLMTAPGWIAREQILGAEARSRVPDEFVVQSPSAANPPTFFLLLSDMSKRVAAAAGGGAWDDVTRADAEFLRSAWPRLKGWYLWFNTTQAGPVPGSYRWRGRDVGTYRELNPKTLTSGLDDYPRASHPSVDERHVDLRCWMARASRAMATIGANIGLPAKEVAPFAATAALLEDFDSLNALHLDPATGQYLDWGNHTEAVDLRQEVVIQDGRRVLTGQLKRVVHSPPKPQFVPHYGYVSLFPLLMELIPADSPILGQQLELLKDPQLLWTDHGLRSLSRSSSLYNKYNTQHDAPYWRGPIWININFLAVKALQHYGDTPGPYQQPAAELHRQLRWNLLHTLVREYRRTGYIWEQYGDAGGEGKGSHPFTGWSALLVLMAAAEQ